jgi:hypothetical protein
MHLFNFLDSIFCASSPPPPKKIVLVDVPAFNESDESASGFLMSVHSLALLPPLYIVPFLDLKGRFSASSFCHESVSPGPPLYSFTNFFLKFAQIFANECLSAVSKTPAIYLSPLSTTPAITDNP